MLSKVSERLGGWTIFRRRSYPGVSFGQSVALSLNKRVDKIGAGSRIDSHAVLSSADGGRITIGERCEIGRGVLILTYGGNIEIGNDCSFNPYCVVYGHGGLKIGNSVRIATHTVVIPSNHGFDDVNVPIRLQRSTSKGIELGDDIWIGAGVRILDGVAIGSGSVIAAGTVVNKSVPPFSIVAGVPGRVIRSRK